MSGFDGWNDELYHHGIPLMKWGRRRWQNPDGSLTEAGKRRYGSKENYERRTKKVKDMSDEELRAHIQRLRTENEYRKLKQSPIVSNVVNTVGKIAENRAKKREQELRKRELAVRLKESENNTKIANAKAKEAEAEAKAYKTTAKQTEMKARLEDSKANRRRARNERKRMSILQTVMRKKESMQEARLAYQKNKDNIDRILAENQGKKINTDAEYWKSEQSRFNAAAAMYGSKKQKDQNGQGNSNNNKKKK